MKKDFSKMLKDHNLKVTPSRLTILEFFSNGCKPVSAEDIFKRHRTHLDQVTIYRTLNSLEEKGIIKKVDLRQDATYYELETDHHHHHIVCTECGKLEEFKECDIDDFSQKILRQSRKFKNITQHSFELFGICTSCAKV